MQNIEATEPVSAIKKDAVKCLSCGSDHFRRYTTEESIVTITMKDGSIDDEVVHEGDIEHTYSCAECRNDFNL